MEKTELTNAQKQNRVRQRISKVSIDPDKYEYIPAKEQNDHVKADQYQQVAIYARVSTDNPMQTTSFELQQKAAEVLRRAGGTASSVGAGEDLRRRRKIRHYHAASGWV